MTSCEHGSTILTPAEKIPPGVRLRTEQRIRAYADRHYAGKFTRLGIRFRGALCYIDAYIEPGVPSRAVLRDLGKTRQQYAERLRNIPLHLCRLRYHGKEDAWSMALYTYSHERYEPCVFDSGGHHGTPEEAFKTGGVYLQDG